jgi:hypothetical protein
MILELFTDSSCAYWRGGRHRRAYAYRAGDEHARGYHHCHRIGAVGGDGDYDVCGKALVTHPTPARKAIPPCMAPNDYWDQVCARSRLDRLLGVCAILARFEFLKPDALARAYSQSHYEKPVYSDHPVAGTTEDAQPADSK